MIEVETPSGTVAINVAHITDVGRRNRSVCYVTLSTRATITVNLSFAKLRDLIRKELKSCGK